MGSKIRREPTADDNSRTSTLRYGDRFGRYVITGFAGKGATSYVYRARRYESFDSVAVKVLHPELVAEPRKRRKFFHEARLMLRMDHPNVVQFREIVETEGRVGFVMNYIDGVTLDDWLERRAGQLDEQTLAMLFIDILRGVAHAHEEGVIHRDLKPSNIMITESDSRFRAKILDFGVARFADQQPHPDDREKIVGTAAYISPEEVERPDAVCRASDIYSLGVMLYEAATGHLPFAGQSPRALLRAHAREEPPSPRQFNPNLSRALEAVIMQTLQKDPDGRFDSADDMIDGLEGAIRSMFGAGHGGRPVEEMAETSQWSRDRDADDAEDGEPSDDPLYQHVLTYLQLALTLFAATGHTGESDDPHHLNRGEPEPPRP